MPTWQNKWFLSNFPATILQHVYTAEKFASVATLLGPSHTVLSYKIGIASGCGFTLKCSHMFPYRININLISPPLPTGSLVEEPKTECRKNNIEVIKEIRDNKLQTEITDSSPGGVRNYGEQQKQGSHWSNKTMTASSDWKLETWRAVIKQVRDYTDVLQLRETMNFPN